MTDFNFDRDVLERSFTVPVLVDFWAEWCGPCRILGPVLESLAEDAAGSWDLVKVNTEEEPALAQEFQIRSIPNVKLFHEGRVIGEFMGALPRHQVEAWLAQHLPDNRLEELGRLISLVEDQDDPEALSDLELFVQQNPDLLDARLYLARYFLGSEPEKTTALLEGISAGSVGYEEAADLKTLALLMALELGSEDRVEANLGRAQAALKANDPDEAVRAVIDAVMVDKNYADDLPRLAGIALFRSLGSDHPVTRKYRKLFDMALY